MGTVQSFAYFSEESGGTRQSTVLVLMKYRCSTKSVPIPPASVTYTNDSTTVLGNEWLPIEKWRRYRLTQRAIRVNFVSPEIPKV